MALSTSPRKVVPLASGDNWKSSSGNSSGPGVTKRVFFCGVVVEGSENGRPLPEDVQELVLSLGTTLPADPETPVLPPSIDLQSHKDPELDTAGQRKRAMTDSSALASVVNELVTTERSYVRRLQILKHDYADPLRKFARNKDTAIIPAYEAKTLFGNIDNLLPVNEAFLTDLEKMAAPNGARTIGGVGDVALRHFKDLHGFEHYTQYYLKREEAQAIFERETMKRSSGFAAYIDRIKYSSADVKNRVGLRELLMDPVQRIPRYTLLFRTMIKYMAPGDPQRAKLEEADEIASKIARAKPDDQTKRAAIWYCLSAAIDGLPPALISNSRRYIDCIDVEDIPTPAPGSSSSGSTSAGSLHCTLFLFDDKLLIAKRPGNGEKGGRALTGLDDLEKLTQAGGLPTGKRKSGMSCKGVVDITDVVATDVGGADMHLYLENPPQDQTERWSGRPFRSLSAVNPPMPVNLDPTQTEADKKRFLEHLWHTQATYRSRAGQSVVLCAEEREVESRGGRVTLARTYFNVYQRTVFLREIKKTKIVVHIDPLGSADPIPFGINTSPFVIIRVQPMAGELCRYTVTSSDPSDDSEEDIVQSARVPSRVVQTIHQYGLFKFRTGNNSLPSTPTASMRSRVAIFGLDAISRNLFNARPGSSRGDFFGGSVSSHIRSKSATSRSSAYTQTTTTGDGSLTRFSHRSNSTATDATTMSTMDDDSFSASRSSKSRKLFKRGRSPANSDSEGPRVPRKSASFSVSRTRSLSREPETDTDYSDVDDDDGTILAKGPDLDQSEHDLAMRLELARRNSNSQHNKQPAILTLDNPVEETIYEDDPPYPVRPISRASKDSSQRSTTPKPDFDNPMDSPTHRPRSPFHPTGPRTPSPLPSKSFSTHIPRTNGKRVANDVISDPASPSKSNHRQDVLLVTPIPRSKRQSFLPADSTTSVKPPANDPIVPSTSVEPLSIKKKTSVRSTTVASPSPMRLAYTRSSPMSRSAARIVSPRRVSPQVRNTRMTAISHSSDENVDQLIHLAQTTKEDVDSSRRAIKRIKLEMENLTQSSPAHTSRPSSPDKMMRTPQRPTPAMTKAAQDRMEEMRQLIGKRQGELTPRNRPHSIIGDPMTPRGTSTPNLDDFTRSLEEMVSDADKSLMRASSNHESLQHSLEKLSSSFKEKTIELEKSRVEVQNARRQLELVKSLLADATGEKEIMYEAFNEELDAMYNDANLPQDDAWIAMSSDLRQTKEARNTLAQENSQLKRRLAEAEAEKEEWAVLLRTHGLIP